MRYVILLTLFALPGCAPADRSTLVSDVLKKDPGFSSALQQRDECESRLQTAYRELALKRQTVKLTIEKLHQDLAESQQAVKQKKVQLENLLAPDRQRLELAISMAAEELRTKREQRAGIGRSMTKIRKALKDPNTNWSAQERARQETQLQEMLQDAKRLDREMAAITEHLRLLKTKLFLLQL